MADRTDVAATLIPPLGAADELLRAVPRLVERTANQAALARSLVAHLPCVGGLVAVRRHDAAPGRVAPEPLGVQDLFDEPASAPASAEPAPTVPAERGAGTAALPSSAPADVGTVAQTPVPTEADLPVADYDSLAASQVVPRLAMLDPQDLRAVQAYEAAHRRRQTILNRVAQLLQG